MFTAVAGPSSPGLGAVTALVDMSLVVAFAHSVIQGEAVVSIRSYPTRADSARLAVQAGCAPQRSNGVSRGRDSVVMP